MKIMFSAGETSGDLHGANLAREILQMDSTVELIGFGGSQMQQAGVRLYKNFSDYNIMGVWEVIKNLRRILKLLDELEDFARREKPNLLVLIDYPDFNWRLAKRIKKLGIPIFSYIPPSAWAWRKGRAKDCAEIADEFVAIFPFELPVYQDAGANISFVGNPLVDSVQTSMSQDESRKFFGVQDEPIILLMPGSRRQEIDRLLPVMIESAELIAKKNPRTRFFLPVAIDGIEKFTSKSKIKIELVTEHRYDLFSIADAAIATSGTVVLEAALLDLPCVIVYKMAAFNFLIAKLFVHVKFFSLPNILLDESIQPELLQSEVTPERITEEISKLFKGNPNRDKVVRDLRRACKKLGHRGSARRVAEKIYYAAESYKIKDRL
ncbi:MAG: lipid-A-disaccharide synthase [Selenomonadaceae bacterium]|nr:lipid-A-disaccharide synthase [Selenomonadaceae bacterium]